MIRFAAICSTGGSVLRHACEDAAVRSGFELLITDRECGAQTLPAAEHVRIPWTDREGFGRAAAAALDAAGLDVALVFFTRILGGELLAPRFRLVNFHPSLLPAFPGMHAVEAALAAGVRVIGSTAHLVDEGVDTGRILDQAWFPVEPGADPVAVRHRIFEDQVRTVRKLVRSLDALAA